MLNLVNKQVFFFDTKKCWLYSKYILTTLIKNNGGRTDCIYAASVVAEIYSLYFDDFFLSLLGILPASNGGRGGGSGRGRGGNRRPEISEADKTKVKLYKHKYEKYLKLKPITNSPFDILVKAAQVQPNFLYSS